MDHTDSSDFSSPIGANLRSFILRNVSVAPADQGFGAQHVDNASVVFKYVSYIAIFVEVGSAKASEDHPRQRKRDNKSEIKIFRGIIRLFYTKVLFRQILDRVHI